MALDPIIYPLGERGLVLDPTPSSPINVGLQRKLCWIAEQLRSSKNILDVVPGMNNLTLFVTQPDQLKVIQQQLETLWRNAKQQQFHAREITIPVTYGGQFGPDLDSVAKYHQLTTNEVIALHCQAQYQVYFIGFQPGFAYLEGLVAKLHTPRLSQPRLEVAAGSVGIGGEQTGIYPSQSPGGWQIIGRTDSQLFNHTSAYPCLLQPGDIVTFEPTRDTPS